ncbi:hypothetical protein [Enterobacter cloacae]
MLHNSRVSVEQHPEEGPGFWVTLDHEYHVVKNLAVMSVNRLTSMSDEGRVFGSDGEDYMHTKRDKFLKMIAHYY